MPDTGDAAGECTFGPLALHFPRKVIHTLTLVKRRDGTGF